MVGPRQRTFRIAAWGCLALLAYLSLIPAEFEVRTGAPGGFEHLIAYLGTAFMFGVGYPRYKIWAALGLVVFGSLMEALQFLPPDRYPSIYDAASSGTGTLLGALAATFLSQRLSRNPANPAARSE